MHSLSKAALVIAAAALAQAASATCYVVYAPDNSVVFRSLQSPVDLSKQLHTTVPAIAPRGRLVFSPDDDGCQFESDKLESLRQAASMTPQPTRHGAKRVRHVRRTNGV